MQALKTDIFQDETFIFTPKGDVIALPQGSTVIDFAYAIHSEVGNSMIGAKINGMIVPIDRVPRNGEIVEILTSSSSRGPSRDWLNIVKTSEARSKIRGYFKREKRSENIVAGRAMVDTELRKISRMYTEAQRNEIINVLISRLGYMNADDLYNDLGYGGIPISKITLKLREEFDKVVKPAEIEAPVELTADKVKISKPKNVKSDSGIIVDGERGLPCQIRNAQSFAWRRYYRLYYKGYGISVHKMDCPVCNRLAQSPKT